MKLDIPKEPIDNIKAQIIKQLPFYQDINDQIEVSDLSITFQVKFSATMNAEAAKA